MDPIQQEENLRLKQIIEQMSARDADREILGEFNGRLFASRACQEAYDVVKHYAPQLFPHTQGALYACSAVEHTTIERVVGWGGIKQRRRTFAQEQCRALCHMRPYLAEGGYANGLGCQHVVSGLHGYCLCVPLLTEGEALGVLHLASEAETLSPWKRKLAEELANYCAMQLASLRLRERLSDEAIRDPRTGLFNVRFLEETLRRELALRMRRPIGIIMIDIDHFRKFNSKFTHAGGDALLRGFAAFLQRQIRPGDMACRYGGEEFILILPGASLDAAADRAQRLRTEVKKLAVAFDGKPLGRISVSLGVTVSRANSQAENVLDGALHALRQAKREGRDRVVVARSAQSATA
jgi:diguanylate cyclase (GGDEF)-like protein